MKMHLRNLGAGLVVALWLGLAAFAWFGGSEEISLTERRPLAQFPELSVKTVLNGQFMSEFGDYTVDQFPLRDGFRTLNAYLTYYLLGKQDNNGIYLHDGYAAKMEYPMSEDSLRYAMDRFTQLHEQLLADSKVYFALVPDKSYYLAEEAGALCLDYDALYDRMAQALPWAELIDLRSSLTIEDYYRTDTHWRQERLIPAAQRIAESLGVTVPEFEQKQLDRPFYGVYYGQAALPMDPETMYYLTNEMLENCTVKIHDNGTTAEIFDETKLESKDLYDVFLSGSRSLLTIENPNAATDRELVIFRDSFGSSMAPLLVPGYSKITLVDLRYMASELIPEYVPAQGQDVLFLYAPGVMNSSNLLK